MVRNFSEEIGDWIWKKKKKHKQEESKGPELTHN